MNAIVPIESNAAAYRASTDAAGLCRDIVVKTAMKIQGKRYVTVEGWQAIAIAHGCTASADHVERVTDEGMTGFKATGMIRRMSDGAEIARAEGFLGDDEGMWAKRPVYARRAMAQTRAISRACRSAFAHVVVMMDAGLATTPAEEVPSDGFDNGNVIDAAPARSNGSKRDAPFAQGPAKNRTELKTLGRAFWKDVEACGDTDQLTTLLRDNRELTAQIVAELPDWWSGGTKDGEPYDGLASVIAKRQTDMLAEAQVPQDEGDWKSNPLIGG